MSGRNLVDVAYEVCELYGLCDSADWRMDDGLLTIESDDQVLLVWEDFWKHLEYNDRRVLVRHVFGFDTNRLMTEMRRF